MIHEVVYDLRKFIMLEILRRSLIALTASPPVSFLERVACLLSFAAIVADNGGTEMDMEGGLCGRRQINTRRLTYSWKLLSGRVRARFSAVAPAFDPYLIVPSELPCLRAVAERRRCIYVAAE